MARTRGLNLARLFMLAALAGLCGMTPQPARAQGGPAPATPAAQAPAPAVATASSAPALQVVATPGPAQPSPGALKPAPKPAVGEEIFAIDYDVGGEGVAYHDTTPGNSKATYRNDDVDVMVQEGYHSAVEGIEKGEWLNYTVDIAQAGMYDVDVLVHSWKPGRKTMHFDLDGKPLFSTPPLICDPENRVRISNVAEDVPLPGGVHTLTAHMDAGGFSFFSIKIKPVLRNWKPSPAATVAFQANWDNDGTPASGAAVTLQGTLPDGTRWRNRVLTDAAGRAAIQGYSLETVTVARATHPLAVQPVMINFDALTSQSVQLKLVKATPVHGRVIMESTGAPVGGALVRVQGSEILALSDAKGEWTLPDVPMDAPILIASKDNLCSFYAPSELRPAELFKFSDNGPLELALREGPLFAGRALDDATGAPIPFATVTMVVRAGGKSDRLQFSADAKGDFQQAGLAGDDVELTLESPSYARFQENIHIAANPKLRREYRMEKGAELAITVLDAQNKPVAGAKVYEAADGDWVLRGLTNAEGKLAVGAVSQKKSNYFYAKLESTSSKGAKPAWVAAGPGHGEMKLAFAPTSKEDMTAEGAFAGRVTDKSGAPLPGVVLRWGPKTNLDEPGDITFTDADGRYNLPTSPGLMNIPMSLTAIPQPPLAALSNFTVITGTRAHPAGADFTLEPAAWLGITVLDPDKNPVGGARVGVTNEIVPPNVLGHMADKNWGYQTTDTGGKVRYDGLAQPSVGVVAFAKGFGPVVLSATKLNQEITITMKPGGSISGQVVDDATGRPLTEFRILGGGEGLGARAQGGGITYTDPEGRFKLDNLSAESPYDLVIQAKDYADATQTGLNAVGKDNPQALVFRMRHAAPVSIELIDAATQAPISGASVYRAVFYERHKAYMRDTPNPRHSEWQYLDEGNPLMFDKPELQKTGADGRATFQEGAEPGVLFVIAANYENLEIQPLERGAYKVGAGHYRIPMKKGVSLSGVCFSPEGGIAAGVKVLLTMDGRIQECVTDAAGRYAFDGLKPGAATLTETVHHEKGDPPLIVRNIQVSAAGAQEMNIGDNLGTHRLTGKLTDGDRPLAFAHIDLVNQFGWEYGTFTAYPDEKGAFAFKGLKPGKYAVNALTRLPNQQGKFIYDFIEIKGDEHRDFDFNAGFKISGRLVFPASMSQEERDKYEMFLLVCTDKDRAALKAVNGIGNLKVELKDGRFEGKGRVKGNYAFYMAQSYKLTNYHPISIPIKVPLDSLGQDQDVGDVVVPAQGGVKFNLVFARPQDRALYSRVGLNTLEKDGKQKAQAEGWTSSLYQSLSDDGVMTIPGRFKGSYSLWLASAASSGRGEKQPTLLQIPGDFKSANPDSETNWGDVIVYPVYHVRARLAFPGASAGATFKLAWLKRMGSVKEGPEAAVSGITQSNSSPIAADGQVDFSGLFAGQYRIVLNDTLNGHSNDGYLLPASLDFDNIDSDKDLGTVNVAPQGFARLGATLGAPGPLPAAITITAGEGLKPKVKNVFKLTGAAGEQKFGPLAPGAQHLQFKASGFTVDPKEADVVIVPGDAAGPLVSVTLAPKPD